MNNIGRILALDYGQRKVGLALSDPLGITASPLTTIRYTSRPRLLEQLQAVIREREVAELVIGVPYTMAGGESRFTKEVKAFVDWISRQVDLPVHTIDERLSSEAAKRTLIQMGVKTGHNKERIDAMAAAHILRDYLDIRDASDAGSD